MIILFPFVVVCLISLTASFSQARARSCACSKTPTFADNIYNKKIAKEGVGSAFPFRCQMGFGSDCVTPTFADNIYNKKIAKEGVGLPSFSLSHA